MRDMPLNVRGTRGGAARQGAGGAKRSDSSTCSAASPPDSAASAARYSAMPPALRAASTAVRPLPSLERSVSRPPTVQKQPISWAPGARVSCLERGELALILETTGGASSPSPSACSNDRPSLVLAGQSALRSSRFTSPSALAGRTALLRAAAAAAVACSHQRTTSVVPHPQGSGGKVLPPPLVSCTDSGRACRVRMRTPTGASEWAPLPPAPAQPTTSARPSPPPCASPRPPCTLSPTWCRVDMTCSASEDEGDVVAMSRSLPWPSNGARSTRVSAVSRVGSRAEAPAAGFPAAATAADLAAKQAFSVIRERFTSCVSLMRSDECADWSRAHSDPARSTMLKQPPSVVGSPVRSASSPAAPSVEAGGAAAAAAGGVRRGSRRYTACERDEAACTVVALVARRRVPSRMAATASAALSTTTPAPLVLAEGHNGPTEGVAAAAEFAGCAGCSLAGVVCVVPPASRRTQGAPA
mmetsp:Transcript_25848/g.81775  ORF Transcript_25848/g.81775 Transcript_25848/m.81775 type:complete len:471 (+) Transcript_25848:671-2083(+)